MASLGFIPGTEVVVLQNFGYGPIIVRVHEAHIALGRGVAARIQIHRDKE
jgi:Fe2+ transport system protein FeoA